MTRKRIRLAGACILNGIGSSSSNEHLERNQITRKREGERKKSGISDVKFVRDSGPAAMCESNTRDKDKPANKEAVSARRD